MSSHAYTKYFPCSCIYFTFTVVSRTVCFGRKRVQLFFQGFLLHIIETYVIKYLNTTYYFPTSTILGLDWARSCLMVIFSFNNSRSANNRVDNI